MSKPLLLTDDEIEQLARALNVTKDWVRAICPREGDRVGIHFHAIGLLVERVEAMNSIGLDVSLVGAASRRDMPGPYTAMAYGPDSVPIIETVMTNRGPMAAVAIAIIRGVGAY